MKLSLLDWRERTEDEGWWPWWWWRRGDDEAELATGGPPEAEAAEAPAAALEIDGPAPHGVEHDEALENTITIILRTYLIICDCFLWYIN